MAAPPAYPCIVGKSGESNTLPLYWDVSQPHEGPLELGQLAGMEMGAVLEENDFVDLVRTGRCSGQGWQQGQQAVIEADEDVGLPVAV